MYALGITHSVFVGKKSQRSSPGHQYDGGSLAEILVVDIAVIQNFQQNAPMSHRKSTG